jgi:4-hydroxy-tetrahydrodipicolinate synthase
VGKVETLVPGIIADIVVPHTTTEELDLDRLRKEVRVLDESGVHAVCIGGVLGGMIGATPAELSLLCTTVRRSTRKPVFATLFPDASPECFEMVRAVDQAGADAILIAQPHYLAQPGTHALEEMFAEIREATGRPVLVADCLPGSMLGVQPIRTLVEKRLVDGVLQAADIHFLVDLLCLRLDVPVYSGVEDLHFPALVLGAHGVISNLASGFPRECASLYAAVHKGNYAEARAMHERLVRAWRALSAGTEREARLRVALDARGRPVGPARSPYGKLSRKAAQHIRSVLKKESLLAEAS